MENKSANVKNLGQDKKLAAGITIIAVMLVLGFGYAFFSASVSNANHETVSTETATLSLKFDDGDSGISGNLNLGESIVKKFTIQNTGTLDAYAKINWYNLVNTYMNGSLTYKLEQSTSENGTYKAIDSSNVPVSSTETTETLKNGILVPVNTKYYYKLTITFNNLENVNQNSDINANFHSFFSLEEGKLTGADKIKNLVAGANTSSTDVITKESPAGASCTNTLAYDGTVDNNLRYVGVNPCNYVSFNGEAPTTGTKWVDTEKASGTEYDVFNTKEECENFLEQNNYTESDECKQKTMTTGGGWRIVGVMNNVDDGTGKKETRIKLVRNDALGNYSWDTSESSVNNGYGVNDWTQADLMQELNGDYLNTSLTSNTMWYNGQSNEKTGEYDYTKGLKAAAQSLIGDAKWHLGGVSSYQLYEGEGTALKFYGYERGTKVWGSTSGQTCNDGACPRKTEWTGKVALIYPSDYGFAVGENVRSTCLNRKLYNYKSDSCHTNNWIFNNSYQWVLSPISGYFNSALYVVNDGYVTNASTLNIYQARPAVYLKSSVSISEGEGTESEPFVIG